MSNRLQFVSCGSPKFRVGEQHVNCELNLVDYALAGTVPGREQFKVFEPVVLPVAVDVMHRFVFVQFATELLRHYVAVFHSFGSFSVVRQGGHGNPDVAVPLDMPADVSRFVAFERRNFLRRNFTFVAAIFLLAVYSKMLAVAASIFFFTALLAREFVSFIRIFAAPNVRTVHRAVHRVFFESFAVSGQVRLHHRKRLFAFFAGEVYRRAARGVGFFVQVLSSALDAAIFASLINLALIAVKRLFAVQAFHFDGHGWGSLFGDKGAYSHAFSKCQVAYGG